jgi:hypothetical protein
MRIAVTLVLRRAVFLDGKRRPDDYEIRYNGQTFWLRVPHAQHRPGAVAVDADRMGAVARAERRRGRPPRWRSRQHSRGAKAAAPPSILLRGTEVIE